MGRVFASLLFVAAGACGEEEIGVLPPVWSGPQYDPATNPEQYVFLTPKGEALVIYPPMLRGSGQPFRKVPLLNQARPHVTVEISLDIDRTFKYVYTVANGPDAGNAIGHFSIVGYSNDKGPEMQHEPPQADEEKRWQVLLQQKPWTLIAQQVKLPGAPTGAYLGWFRNELRNRIDPGQSLGGFLIQSSLRPGFTTGFVSTGHQWELDPNWGDEVFLQLRFLNRTEWRDQPLLTLGPRYTSETGRQAIAQEFLAGLEQWIKDGNLAADSPFVRHLAADLRTTAETGEAKAELPEATSEYERMLLNALHLTLGYGTGGEE